MMTFLDIYRQIISKPVSCPDDLRASHHLRYPGDPDRHTTVLRRLALARASNAVAEAVDDSTAQLVVKRRKVTKKVGARPITTEAVRNLSTSNRQPGRAPIPFEHRKRA